jgi:hypothetical protein
MQEFGISEFSLIENQLPTKMMTNISRQLTTGALAIAGSVATFGFGAIANAQVAANATFGGTTGGVTFTGNLGTANSISLSSLTGFVTSVPSTYTPFGGSTAPNDFNTANSLDPGSTFLAFPAGLTGFTVGIVGGGSTLDFTGTTTEGITLTFGSSTTPANRYSFTAASGSIVSQTNTGLNVAFFGTFTDADGFFSSSAATVSLSIAASGVGQGTDTFTFGTPPAFIPQGTPEPSAILGILAVAGAGAFARRKS